MGCNCGGGQSLSNRNVVQAAQLNNGVVTTPGQPVVNAVKYQATAPATGTTVINSAPVRTTV
jgi:hypothetical protein